MYLVLGEFVIAGALLGALMAWVACPWTLLSGLRWSLTAAAVAAAGSAVWLDKFSQVIRFAETLGKVWPDWPIVFAAAGAAVAALIVGALTRPPSWG